MISTPVYAYFLNARQIIISHGYGSEIEWVQNRDFEKLTAREFLVQYQFAVFCSSGLNNKVVTAMEERFYAAYNNGENAFNTIKNRRMRTAIMEMYAYHRYKDILNQIRKIPDNPARIEFLQTLKQIGKKEKFHLARNLGIDCIKPDIHMDRLAESFGYKTPLELCLDIQHEEPTLKLGEIDVILWRYCNLTHDYGGRPSDTSG